MDRDVALQLLAKLTAVNTALTTLSTNTSPSNANRSVDEDDMRRAEDPEELREDPEPEPEPEPEPVKTTKSTKGGK